MKKILFVFILALGASLSLGAESSKPTSAYQASLSQADMQMLFKSSDVNVKILTEKEMKETQGEGLLAKFATFLAKIPFNNKHPRPWRAI